MIAPTTILVGRIGKVFWLRVEGKGTFQHSVQVKRAFQAVINGGMRDLVVDLERCPMMDSTFLGAITSVALKLRDLGGGTFRVLNANQRNQQLLISLGLDHIVDLDVEGTAWPEERRQACLQLANCTERGASCKEEHTHHVLQAHQTLASLSGANQGRFRDVIQFLEKELGATASAPAPEPVTASS